MRQARTALVRRGRSDIRAPMVGPRRCAPFGTRLQIRAPRGDVRLTAPTNAPINAPTIAPTKPDSRTWICAAPLSAGSSYLYAIIAVIFVIEKNPAERFQSAREMAAALTGVTNPATMEHA